MDPESTLEQARAGSRALEGLRWALRRELIPDPRGTVGFAIALGVLVSHLALASLAAAPRAYLWSEHLAVEVLGHVWLLLGPPLSVYLGVRNLVVRGDSLLPLLSVPLGLLLTAATLLGLALSALGA